MWLVRGIYGYICYNPGTIGVASPCCCKDVYLNILIIIINLAVARGLVKY